MTIVMIEHSDFPWLVSIRRDRAITQKWRADMLNWMVQNFGRENFQLIDGGGNFEIMRFAKEEDAILFKLRYEACP